jgi:hypothetical protein
MIFICAQPAILYYSWQVEVMINNFIENNINESDIHIISYIVNNKLPNQWVKLKEYYKNVNFYFYDDTRKTKHYISSIRPNILKQHFKLYPEITKDKIFYHDSDILLTKEIDWSKFESDDIFYGSDTRSYVGYNYIKSKGDDILNKMLEIVDIDGELVKKNQDNTIGAQYILKDIDYNFWENIENNSENLYYEITKLNNIKKKENLQYHELQIWCADMFAILWEIWKQNKETKISDDLSFSWGTSSMSEYNKHNIFHNAGVTTSKDGLFYKGEYINKLPYNLNLSIKEGTASRKYYEAVQKTEKISCII